MNKTQKHSTLVLLFAVFLTLFCLLPESDCNGQEPENEATLRFAIVPEKNSFEQLRRYKYITDYLSQETGLNVTVEIMANYGEISKAFENKSADAGIFGSFSFVLTNSRVGIEPIARPVWLDGSSTYRGYIFVRKDSGIESVADMKNKDLVLVDKATTAGYFFQIYYFKYYGITDLENYFSRISFARSHDAAAWSVYTGEADIGGAKNHIYNELMEKYPDFKNKMMIIAESPEVPSNGFAVRQDLNSAIKLRLKTLLLTMHQNEKGRKVLENFGARRFVETSYSDYQVLYNMAEDMEIDLKTYSYN